jgi:hypothetical protein
MPDNQEKFIAATASNISTRAGSKNGLSEVLDISIQNVGNQR